MAIDLGQARRSPERAATPASATGGGKAEPWVHPLRRWAQFDLTGGRISLGDLVVFTQQLALLLRGGNGLVPSIDALAEQVESRAFRAALEEIHDRLEAGGELSECLERHPRIFDRLYVSIVRAGEASGKLQSSLEQLGRILETRQRLQSEIREAMTYPIILTVIMVIVVIFMLVYMVPRFGDLFTGLGDELPFSTRLILAAGDFLRSRWWTLIPILGLAAIGGRKIWNLPAVRDAWDRGKMKLPLIGGFFADSYLYQVFSSFGLLLGSRVPHLEAIGIVRRAIRNVHYERFFARLSEHVETGRGVASAFQEADFLPRAVKLMVTTGESSGALDRAMLGLSERYRESLERGIRRLSSMIEPVLLVVMGLMVGFLAISFIVPLFKLSRAVH